MEIENTVTKPRITMVIPTYTLTEDLEELAIVGALTYRDQVQQLIVTEDGGNYSKELSQIADIYIYSKTNVGFTRNVNRGWKLSTGDYTMVVNSDTQLIDGNLQDLCIPNKVTCPITHTENVPYFWGAYFVVPKSVQEEYGMLDERMVLYGSDSEYEKRIGHIYQPVQTVEILHHLNQTTNQMGDAPRKQQAIDREVYAKILREEYK